MRQRIDFCLARQTSEPRQNSDSIDLDLSLIQVRMLNLELRKADIVAGRVERGTFDLVTARAVLHHVNDTGLILLLNCGAT